MSNYATWNPLAYKVAAHTGAYYAEGNTKFVVTQVDTYGQFAVTTMPMPMSGKWYVELLITSSGSDWPQFGFIPESDVTQMLITDNIQGGTFANFSVMRPNDGNLFPYGTTASSGYGNGFSSGDTAMLAFDGTTGKAWWGKNGTWFGDPTAGTGNGDTFSEPVFVTAGSYLNAGTITLRTRTETFSYTPPSGFVALNTKNLPEPVISNKAGEKPEDYFNVVTYMGNGSTQSITGVGFQPDFVWIKERNGPDWHGLFDVVRGTGKYLGSNVTNAESGDNSTGLFESFDSDGFTVNTSWLGGTNTTTNGSGQNAVAWCWKAGGTAVTNNDGSLTTQVSANTDAGFSIITYTGAGSGISTIGHGLNQAPEFWVTKPRTSVGDDQWFACHVGIASDYYNYWLHWDNNSARQNAAPRWGGVAPTDSVISIGDYSTNKSGNYVCYAWHSVPGFSKFGSYQGNGSNDGPFVYTGFRPSYLMVKEATGTGSWLIVDSIRDPYNASLTGNHLEANTSLAEKTPVSRSPQFGVDFVSNGFKYRGSHDENNESGQTYIYMAFADSPFKYATGR
jgi:hypothetical protein